MKRVAVGSLTLTLVAGVMAISAGVAGATPSRSAVPYWQTYPCVVTGRGPTDVQLLADVSYHAIGDTTIEAGKVTLLDPADGHTHTFYVGGIVTYLGPGTGGFGASSDYVASGALIWEPRDNIQYLVGTGTTVGGTFDNLTSHTGRLYNACDFVE